MKRFTDNELLCLLNDTESDRAEQKETFKGDVPKKARHCPQGTRKKWKF